MRQGSNARRPRGRPHRKQQGGSPRHNNFDSSGPEGRIRGNAHQVYEKYIALARDATSSGDRISAETYYQHAEHYFRVLNARTDPKPEGDGQQGRQSGNGHVGAAAGNGAAGPNGQAEPPAGSGEQPQPAVPANDPAEAVAANGEQPRAQAPRRRKPAQAAKPAQPEQTAEPAQPAQPETDEPSSEDGETTGA